MVINLNSDTAYSIRFKSDLPVCKFKISGQLSRVDLVVEVARSMQDFKGEFFVSLTCINRLIMWVDIYVPDH